MPRIQVELVKKILLALEDSFPDWRGIDVGIEDDRLRSYYIDFLRRDGLVEAKNWGFDQTGDDWKATGLTPDGHRMAEALRAAPPDWREQATSLGAEGLSLTWEVAKRYLSQLPDEESRAWDAFVCYASEDREAVARPLATFLSDLGLRVWYDEMELRVGDRLRRKVDAGLARCEYGVVILSESFFGKHYPESELDGLAQREQDGRDLILPVWHDVDVEIVRRHSPRLADRFALKWQEGIESVAAGLLEVIAPDLLRDVIERDRELDDYVKKAQVPRVTTGIELTTLLETFGFFFFNDEPGGQDVNLVGGFQQDLADWSDIWTELGPQQRVEAASHLTEQLEALHEQGWTVHGRIERRQNSVGGKPIEGPMAVVAVVRGDPRGVMYLGDGQVVIVREDGKSSEHTS